LPAVEQLLQSEQPLENQWDKVDDFKWLKVEHSPNWSVLPLGKRITPRVWRDVVPGGPNIVPGDILKETVGARQ
jgi:tubulin-specific chaperone C